MSIIFDALKKVDIKLGGPPHKIAALTPRKSKQNNIVLQLKITALFLVIIIAGFIIAKIFFSAVVPSAIPNKEAITMANAPVAKKAVSAAAQPEQAQGPFVLNGVFFSEEEGYALVNNQIVQVGDTIDEAKVLKVDWDGVELDLNGTAIKLINRKK